MNLRSLLFGTFLVISFLITSCCKDGIVQTDLEPVEKSVTTGVYGPNDTAAVFVKFSIRNTYGKSSRSCDIVDAGASVTRVSLYYQENEGDPLTEATFTNTEDEVTYSGAMFISTPALAVGEYFDVDLILTVLSPNSGLFTAIIEADVNDQVLERYEDNNIE